MTKILVDFLSFAKFVIRNDKGIASFGPMNVLAGISVLGLSFCVVGFSGLQSTQIAQSVSTIQMTQTVSQGVVATPDGEIDDFDRGVCTIGKTEATVLISAQKAALEALGE